MTAPRPTRWYEVAEKGSAAGIALLAGLARLLGRRLAGLVLRVVAFWYVCFAADARRASRAYLLRVQGRAALGDVYRHVWAFARVALDRVFLVRGDLRPFTVTTEGEEHLQALAEARRGAVVILSHLGSFEALRSMATRRRLPMNVVGYFSNARLINAMLRRLDPAAEARLISIRPNDPSFIFDIQACVERGELVGTMGDRVGHDGKAVAVPFLGAPAPFPTGPWLLASVLECPVLLAFGLYEEPNVYRLVCEPFAERVTLPRGDREAALRAHVARYAARLEHHCRAFPHAWFNFYDFWSSP